MAHVYFDLAHLSRMEDDRTMALIYAEQAATALRQTSEDLRFGQQVQVFLAKLNTR